MEMPDITIEPLRTASDLRLCCDIWLAASQKGHWFVDGDFWWEKYQDMLALHLPGSRVHIAVCDGVAAGFSATSGDMLAALFVHPDRWGKGIGKALLAFLAGHHGRLRLAVYEKNERAANFYRRFGFKPIAAGVCPDTGEKELHMQWIRADAPAEKGAGEASAEGYAGPR